MFADLDADVSVLVDGNAAYDPPSAPLIGASPRDVRRSTDIYEVAVNLNGKP